MSAADLLEDGFPHGTPDGYGRGCRGAGCPSGLEQGLSCRTAWEKSKGDYQYQKLARSGASVAEIAAALHAHPEHHEPPKRKVIIPDDADPELDEVLDDEQEETEMSMTEEVVPSPATIVKSKKPEPPAVVPEWPEEASERSDTSSQADLDISPAAVRAWAREAGIDVNPRGKVRVDVVSAYVAASGKPVDVAKSAAELLREKREAEGRELVEVEPDPEPIEPLPVLTPEDARAVLTTIVHGPIAPDIETRAELFNEGFDEAMVQVGVDSTIALGEALSFALRKWAAEVERSRDLELKLRRAEVRIALARRPWWRRA